MDVQLTAAGTRPLLMHNGRLANPLDPAAKRLAGLTGKRSKTDDDHAAIADAEWLGALYTDEVTGAPELPVDNLWRSLFDAAKKNKLGESVKRGLLVISVTFEYDGPQGIRALAADPNHRLTCNAKVSGRTTPRTRPLFRSWGFAARLLVDDSELDKDDVRAIAERAGTYYGLGDWRPRHGTFKITEFTAS
jgi:hypothetical protein